MVAIDMSERAPSRVIKYMTYAKTCVTFYVFSLFIYLFDFSIIFLHFYICKEV